MADIASTSDSTVDSPFTKEFGDQNPIKRSDKSPFLAALSGVFKGRVQWLLALAITAVPAFASGIQYVCDTTVSASVCTTLQTNIAGQYAAIFTNANAIIYVEVGGTGSSVSENTQFYNTVSYAAYYDALVAHESGANDATAVVSLRGGTTNPVGSSDGVAVTSSLDAALGLAGAYGVNTSDQSCTIGNSGCYNDIITVSKSLAFYYDIGSYISGEYDFFTAVEHETDEALGTSSCIANTPGGTAPTPSSGCANGQYGQAIPGVSAADLFRYSAPGTRTFVGANGNQAEGSSAYFSINGGKTPIAWYNNTNNDNDYGDWEAACKYVQDAVGCNNSTSAGLNITNDGGAEVAALDAVGYNLTNYGEVISGINPVAAPEPDTTELVAWGLLAVLAGGIVRRRSSARRKVSDRCMGKCSIEAKC